MILIKKLTSFELRDLQHHRDNTSTQLIKGYTLSQLSLMDGIDTRTIKRSGNYLPIRVDNGRSMCLYRSGKMKKPYRILWIRLDEIKYIFNKKTGKKLEVEI